MTSPAAIPHVPLPRVPGGRDVRRVALFLMIFLTLNFLYYLGRGGAVERVVLDVMTVIPAVALINALTPAEQVVADGHRLVAPQAALSVLGGCEGIESIFLVIAALGAFRLGWKDTVLGMVVGTLFIYALNLLRIAGLYYVFRYQRDWFDIAHAYIGSTIIIVMGCLFFLFWVNRSLPRHQPRPGSRYPVAPQNCSLNKPGTSYINHVIPSAARNPEDLSHSFETRISPFGRNDSIGKNDSMGEVDANNIIHPKSNSIGSRHE